MAFSKQTKELQSEGLAGARHRRKRENSISVSGLQATEAVSH